MKKTEDFWLVVAEKVYTAFREDFERLTKETIMSWSDIPQEHKVIWQHAAQVAVRATVTKAKTPSA